jgi:S-sulfo-L-cysteine synthase (3-phospho-L-serine-dependent)
VSDLVLLVESNTSGSGLDFVRTAKRLGCRPVLLTSDPSRYPFAGREVEVTVTETTPAALEDAVRNHLPAANGARALAVVSSSEYFIEAAARLARRLGLPGPDPDAIARCRDKHVQRQWLRAAGVRVPEWIQTTSVEDAIAFARTRRGVVAKPLMGSGSVGVRLCREERELRRHVDGLLARETNERGMPIPRRVLVEEYLAGDEVSVECFDGSPLVVTRKHLGPLPHFVEVGHDLPAALAPEATAAVTETASKALDTLRLSSGPAHVELRLTGDRAAVIEVNPRLAGGHIPRLAKRACGVDLVEATLRSALGRSPGFASVGVGYASIRFLLAGDAAWGLQPGYRSRSNDEGVQVETEVYEAARPRPPQHDFRDRIAHVIAWGDTASQVSAAAERGLAQLLDTDDSRQPVLS